MKSKVSIFWFRRDLRLIDNAGLYHALKGENPVLPIFLFDRNILDDLEDRSDRRVQFIHLALSKIQQQLVQIGSTLDVRYGLPLSIFSDLINEYEIEKVFTNSDYEPYATQRDNEVAAFLKIKGITFHSYKDQVIFEKSEIVKDNGTPYTIFTPYSRKWKAGLSDFFLKSYPTEKYFAGFFRQVARSIPSLEEMKFRESGSGDQFPHPSVDAATIKYYSENRNFPSLNGTSRLGIHLRFGTIGIRQLAKEASGLSDVFLNELIWRDFFQMILWHFPNVVNHSFKAEYDKIAWRNNETEFEAWSTGQTGYPIVDAGMRELNATGFMHNRVRMIVASFLTKHLLIDWRWGEAYFAKKLLDYDLAANNGGWQWAAGTGCDSAPYFRIFNPYLQTKKFDPELKYVRKWVPEFEEFHYPGPIVDHELARKRCLAVYAAALKK